MAPMMRDGPFGRIRIWATDPRDPCMMPSVDDVLEILIRDTHIQRMQFVFSLIQFQVSGCKFKLAGLKCAHSTTQKYAFDFLNMY
jgi:hypothetical protein